VESTSLRMREEAVQVEGAYLEGTLPYAQSDRGFFTALTNSTNVSVISVLQSYFFILSDMPLSRPLAHLGLTYFRECPRRRSKPQISRQGLNLSSAASFIWSSYARDIASRGVRRRGGRNRDFGSDAQRSRAKTY
jgi:hypothetical protein